MTVRSLSYGAPKLALTSKEGEYPLRVVAAAHALGRAVVDTREVEKRLSKPPGWLEARTGIASTRQCADDEDAHSLAVRCLRKLLDDCRLASEEIGEETILMYVPGGLERFATPPAGNVLASSLGLRSPRVLTLDLACGAAVAVFELAATLLSGGACARVIIVSSSDLDPFVGPSDLQASGLFAAGAGGVVLELATGATGIRAIRWKTYPEHALVGGIAVTGLESRETGMSLSLQHYRMDGTHLARILWSVVPSTISDVLSRAHWNVEDVDHWITHQPAPRLLDALQAKLRIRPETMEVPARQLGNNGPASAFISWSLARRAGKLVPGRRVMLVAFGFGLSAGAAAIQL